MSGSATPIQPASPQPRRVAASPGLRAKRPRRAAQPAQPAEPTVLRAAVSWAAARVMPVLRVVTPMGWVCIAAGAALLGVGVGLGWEEAVVGGLVLWALAVNAALFTVGRSPYEVAVDLTRRRVSVGEVATGEVRVRNTSRRATLPADVELPVGLGMAAFPLPRLAGGAEHSDPFTIPTARRAVITVGPVRSARGDALGLMRREVTWTQPVELFVHPRTISLDGSSAGFLRDLEGLPTDDLSSSDVSFHALRDYTPGDDRRHIHWKTTARTGKLMVRQFEETRRSHLLVALSTATHEYAADAAEEFELAVSAASSLALQALKEGKDITYLSHARRVRCVTGMRMLDETCRLETAAIRATLADLARVGAGTVPDASVAVLVFGSSVEPAMMRLAAAAMPVETITVAVRCNPGVTLMRRTMGDLTVFDLGDLADLPRAMRRVGA